MSQSGSCDQHLGLWEGKPRHALAELQWAEARAAQEDKPRHTERRGPRGAGEKNEVQICFPSVLPSFLRPPHSLSWFLYDYLLHIFTGTFFFYSVFFLKICSATRDKPSPISRKENKRPPSYFQRGKGKREQKTSLWFICSLSFLPRVQQILEMLAAS